LPWLAIIAAVELAIIATVEPKQNNNREDIKAQSHVPKQEQNNGILTLSKR